MSDFKSGIVRMRSRARSDATHSHEKHRNRTRSDASDGLQPLTSSDFSPLRSVREAFILPEEESLQLTRRGTRTTFSLSPPHPSCHARLTWCLCCHNIATVWFCFVYDTGLYHKRIGYCCMANIIVVIMLLIVAFVY